MTSSEKRAESDLAQDAPYLSFCVHSRNDNHGGDMYRRMKACLMGFFEQAERYRLRSEIILVDWNPPKNRPLLKDAYQWPESSQFCTIRVIIVPPHIHERYPHWEKIPVNNCAAQNAAIRRAKGTYILSTCVDNLLSDELFCFLASENLGESKMYRIDRCNVNRAVTRLKSVEEQIAYCRKNILKIDRFVPNLPLPGFEGTPGLYTGSPGDFTLLARKVWHKVRGYPEIDLVGRTSDSVLCYMAYLAGAEIEALRDPMQLYHIDHDVRTNSTESNWWTRTGLKYIFPDQFARTLRSWTRRFLPAKSGLKRLGIPIPSETDLKTLIIDMITGKRSHIYNDDTWGLGAENLKEFVVVQPEVSLVQAERSLTR